MWKQMVATVLIAGSATVARGDEKPPEAGWIPADPAVECADVPEKALCAELLELRDKDQIPRHRLLESPQDPRLAAELEKVDAENLARLLKILDDRGWPRRSQVGERAAGAAWLIIQHADLATQQRFIGTMQEAVEAGELDPGLVALTVDRIRVGEGKPQIYGTQFRMAAGELVLEPLEDPEHVDERRASVGLPPLAEYEAAIRKLFAAQAEAADPDAPR